MGPNQNREGINKAVPHSVFHYTFAVVFGAINVAKGNVDCIPIPSIHIALPDSYSTTPIGDVTGVEKRGITRGSLEPSYKSKASLPFFNSQTSKKCGPKGPQKSLDLPKF